MYRMESTPRDRNHHELNSSALCCNKPSCVGRGRGRQRTGPEALTTTFLFSKIGFGLKWLQQIHLQIDLMFGRDLSPKWCQIGLRDTKMSP